MSGEKKHWRLPTPFRKFPGKQDLGPKAKGRSRSSVSTVYLSGDTSASGLIIVPEFDDLRVPTIHEQPHHASHLSKLPTSPNSSSPDSADSYIDYRESRAFQCSPYLDSGPFTGPDDELSQRLGSAYEHIRSMSSATPHEVSLSSDPQMLRKQLGVPQHSVLNYPIHSSPDLPNPHTAPVEITPHRLSPTTSSNISHTRTSRKPGARIDTNVYPNSSRNAPPDISRSAQRSSVANASTLTESSSVQCSMHEVPKGVHVVWAPKPQLSASNPSKPPRLGAEEPTVSSCFPSPRRQTSRNVLQETVFDAPSPMNAHGQQTSIQIRSPSPFTVDIPLHHTWHDRRTDFKSASEYHSKVDQIHETESRQTSESTEVLASLAWIGTSPMTSSSYTTNQKSDLEFLPDHFGMAIAVEDDSISDDALVDRLEKVRRISGPSTRGTDILPSTIPDNAHLSSRGRNENWHTACLSSSPSTDQLGNIRPPSSLASKGTTSGSEDAEVWHAARKTLLCIREIIRTEKKYQEALKMLLNAQTTTPPPRSMVAYISALVRASEMLLKGLLEDPSAWGVSTAFVTSEDELEATMISWCAVAGAFFMDGNDPQSSGLVGRWRLRKSGMMPSPSPSVTKQTSINPRLEQERQTASVSLQKAESTESQATTGLPPGRKLSVRDLAIQPIQRVMRYVLLYKDLLDCTPPTSPSRLLVERALEAATRIANQCDKAQRNPAFFHAS